MRSLPHLLRKEFRQIFRNKAMLPIIFVMPIIQLLILVNAADFELKNINIAFIDDDRSTASQQLIGLFQASDHFRVVDVPTTYREGIELLDEERSTVVLRIPARFEHDLRTSGKADLAVDINGIDGQAAGLSAYYVGRIVQGFNADMVMHWRGLPSAPTLPITIREQYWYNPDLNYKNYMLPGLLVLLVTMVGMFLSSMNIVREIEIGTIEQINVTPIRKYEFIIGKLLPFWMIGMFVLGFGLTIGVLLYDIPIRGSVPLLFTFAAVYLPVVLGFGLLVSTRTQTQQQAMFVSWFVMVIFMLMSGLFTPIENMPRWAQAITWFNPTAYFIEVVRLVLLKGSGPAEVARHFGIMILFAAGVNILAVASYRKRAA